MSHLEVYLDTLRLLPNEFHRHFQLLSSLDNRCVSLKQQMDLAEDDCIELMNSKQINETTLKSAANTLSECRELQNEAHSISTEKVELVSEAISIIQSYLTRVEDDMKQFESDYPEAIARLNGQSSSINASSALSQHQSQQLNQSSLSSSRNNMMIDDDSSISSAMQPKRKNQYSNQYSRYSNVVPSRQQQQQRSSSSNYMNSMYNNDSLQMRAPTNDIVSINSYEDPSMSSSQVENDNMVNSGLMSRMTSFTFTGDGLDSANNKYNNDASAANNNNNTSPEELFCFCQQPSYGEMVSLTSNSSFIEIVYFALITSGMIDSFVDVNFIALCRLTFV